MSLVSSATTKMTWEAYKASQKQNNGGTSEVVPTNHVMTWNEYKASQSGENIDTQEIVEQEPTKRGIMDRIFGMLGYSGITEGLYNMVDDDENSTFASGLREGLKYMNPFTNDVSGRHTFSDFLEEAGWEDKNPDKLGLDDIGRGIVGFAGDVLTDPLTYINPYGAISKVVKGTGIGTDVAKGLINVGKADEITKEISRVIGGVNAENIARLKKLDFDTAKKIVMEGPIGHLSEEEINAAAEQLVQDFNYKVLKLREGGDGLTIGAKFLPFSNKIKIGDKTLASFSKELISSKKLRELGDKTIAPYYNDLAKKLRTSRIGSKFNTNAIFEKYADENLASSAALFHAKNLLEGVDRINLDIADIKNGKYIQDYFESLDEDAQLDFLDAIESGIFDDVLKQKEDVNNIKSALGSENNEDELKKIRELYNSVEEYKKTTGYDDLIKKREELLSQGYQSAFPVRQDFDDEEMFNKALNKWVQENPNSNGKITDIEFDIDKPYITDATGNTVRKRDGLKLIDDDKTVQLLTKKYEQKSGHKWFEDVEELFGATPNHQQSTNSLLKPTYNSMKERFGDEGLKVAKLIIDRMAKAADDEVARGLLSKDAAEKLKGSYLMHISKLDKEAFDKLLQENNGAWNPDILGFIKNYNHRRAVILDDKGKPIKNTINNVNDFYAEKFGERILETALHEIYLSRALGSNRLIYGHDVQKFIDNNFTKELDWFTTADEGYSKIMSYKDIENVIYRAAHKNGKFKPIGEAFGIDESELIKTLKENSDSSDPDDWGFADPDEKIKYLRDMFKRIGDENSSVMYAPNIPMQTINETQESLLYGLIGEKSALKIKPRQMRTDLLQITNQLSRKQQQRLQSDTLNLYDRLLTIWKLNNTLVMPGFHLQNAVSNAFQSFLAISEDALNPKKLKRAYTIFTNPDPKQIMKIGDKEYTYKELNYMATKLGVIDDMFHTFEFNRSGEGGMLPHIPKGLDPTDVEGFVLNKIGTNVGTKIEGTQRMNLWLSCLEKGQTPKQAVETVNKYLFDYSDLTDFEQQTVKRVIPFYTFMKKNAPMELEAMLTQPQKFVQLQKGFTNFEKMGGDYEGENERNEWRQEYIQIPNTGYGVSDQLPYNQLERIVDPQKVLGQTSPLIKTPLEMIMGKYMYTGIDIGGPVEYIANQTAPTKVAYNTANKDGVLNKILYAIGQLDGFPIGEM